MPYKPWIIVFLSVVYFISPPIIIITTSYVSLVPLTGQDGIFSRLSLSDISILITYLAIGLCLLSMRKWGWWGFILLSLYLIGYNLLAYLKNPFYSPLSLIIFTILLTTAAGLLFRKELIAPYFNPRLRWWETDRRYDLSFRCRINFGRDSLSVPVFDISRGGCFLAVDKPAPLSRILTLDISINRLFLSLKGEVVRGATEPVKGWGIVFKDLSVMESRGIKELINLLKIYHGEIHDNLGDRRHRRYANPFYVYLGGEGVTGERRIHSVLENISRSGFCLTLEDDQWLSGEKKITLELPPAARFTGREGVVRPLPGEIVWSRKNEHSLLLGAEFSERSAYTRKIAGELIRNFKKMGGRERGKSRPWDRKLIDESFLLTPRGKLRALLKVQG